MFQFESLSFERTMLQQEDNEKLSEPITSACQEISSRYYLLTVGMNDQIREMRNQWKGLITNFCQTPGNFAMLTRILTRKNFLVDRLRDLESSPQQSSYHLLLDGIKSRCVVGERLETSEKNEVMKSRYFRLFDSSKKGLQDVCNFFSEHLRTYPCSKCDSETGFCWAEQCRCSSMMLGFYNDLIRFITSELCKIHMQMMQEVFLLGYLEYLFESRDCPTDMRMVRLLSQTASGTANINALEYIVAYVLSRGYYISMRKSSNREIIMKQPAVNGDCGERLANFLIDQVQSPIFPETFFTMQSALTRKTRNSAPFEHNFRYTSLIQNPSILLSDATIRIESD